MTRPRYTDAIHTKQVIHASAYDPDDLSEWDDAEERTQMLSNRYAHWCKPGQHSFDPDDPEQKTITVKNRDGDEVSILTCGEHLQKVFELASPKDENSPEENDQ